MALSAVKGRKEGAKWKYKYPKRGVTRVKIMPIYVAHPILIYDTLIEGTLQPEQLTFNTMSGENRYLV